MDGALEFERRPVHAELAATISRFARMVKTTVRSHNLARHGIDEDDVEQEVRIRLWTALAREPSRQLPGAYVQRVVFSAVVDALRRERVRRRDLQDDFGRADDLPDLARQPDALVAQRQWTEFLHRCIERLPARRQFPVQLYLLGYSFQEVAHANGITLDAGSKLVRRGLADLRALLKEYRRPD
jgi:RNA polymerase sigma-70 factor (ECF subfamily)